MNRSTWLPNVQKKVIKMENNKPEEKIYTININKKASKFLESLSEPHRSSIVNAILSLAYNPRPFGYIKLTGEDAYRIRIGDYRVIYEIFEGTITIDVIRINHRKEVYKKKIKYFPTDLISIQKTI